MPEAGAEPLFAAGLSSEQIGVRYREITAQQDQLLREAQAERASVDLAQAAYSLAVQYAEGEHGRPLEIEKWRAIIKR
jgi:hypothetical protein